MRKHIGMIVALGLVVSVSAAAQKAPEQTWTGRISDSMCEGKHSAGEHEGKKMTDADCTKVCVKGGAKYSLRVRGQGLSAGQSEFQNHRFACRTGSETDWRNEGRHHHGVEDDRCQVREVTQIFVFS